MQTIATFFTGKGTTLKLAIVLSIFAAFGFEVMEEKYSVNASSNDTSFTINPAGAPISPMIRSQQLSPESLANQGNVTNMIPQAGTELPTETQQG